MRCKTFNIAGARCRHMAPHAGRDHLFDPAADRLDAHAADLPIVGSDVVCPLCKREHVAIVDHHGMPALEPHRIKFPLVGAFLGELADILFRVQCPASWGLVTRVCDGEHAAPACSDPCCYHSEPTMTIRLAPKERETR